jgi:hypothetical protein
MAVEKDYYKRAIEAAKFLSQKQREQLIAELSEQLEETVMPLHLSGTWSGVSLSAEEIDAARRECWASLGDDH